MDKIETMDRNITALKEVKEASEDATEQHENMADEEAETVYYLEQKMENDLKKLKRMRKKITNIKKDIKAHTEAMKHHYQRSEKHDNETDDYDKTIEDMESEKEIMRKTYMTQQKDKWDNVEKWYIQQGFFLIVIIIS